MNARRIEGDLWDFGIAASPTGNDRLCLRYVGEDSFDFHELVWERNVEGKWVRYRTLPPQIFLCSRNGSPWVAELHSFDSAEGTAIVKVGESGEPDKNGSSHVVYSWRRVSFVESLRPEVLQICQDPFEAYDG